MKKTTSPLLCLCLCLCTLLTSCGAQNAQITTKYTPMQITQIIIAAQRDAPPLTPLTPGDDLYDEYIESNYQLDADNIEDGVICYAIGVEATEITILLLNNNADAKKTAEALENYKDRRISALIGYVPDQADLVQQGIVVTQGPYAALLICADAKQAKYSISAILPPG